jgi:hypothetical protein
MRCEGGEFVGASTSVSVVEEASTRLAEDPSVIAEDAEGSDLVVMRGTPNAPSWHCPIRAPELSEDLRS